MPMPSFGGTRWAVATNERKLVSQFCLVCRAWVSSILRVGRLSLSSSRARFILGLVLVISATGSCSFGCLIHLISELQTMIRKHTKPHQLSAQQSTATSAIRATCKEMRISLQVVECVALLFVSGQSRKADASASRIAVHAVAKDRWLSFV
jgi:hypothetical protein